MLFNKFASVIIGIFELVGAPLARLASSKKICPPLMMSLCSSHLRKHIHRTKFLSSTCLPPGNSTNLADTLTFKLLESQCHYYCTLIQPLLLVGPYSALFFVDLSDAAVHWFMLSTQLVFLSAMKESIIVRPVSALKPSMSELRYR